MNIKKIILNSFKGVREAEYDFNGNQSVTISGKNGSGKTTIADAYDWVFADKDYSLKSNPEVHPTFMDESEPSVEIICDIDGKEVSFRKFQKDSRTKKQKEAGAPVRISNQYEVNSVPKSQKDFESALAEYGIDKDKFLLLTHPEIFMSQKTADCRKILFGMVSDVSDIDIAKELGFAEVSDLLENYKVDEITAMKKREKKEASENIDSLPEQIKGLEEAKVNADWDALKNKESKLQAEIDTAENDIRENPVESIGVLNEKAAIVKAKMEQLNRDADSERRASYEKERSVLVDIMNKYKSAQLAMESKNYEVANALTKKRNAEARFKELEEEFKRVKAEEFDESSNICKYCGQTLPADRANENRRRYEKAKEEKKHAINQDAKDVKKMITAYGKEAEQADAELAKAKAELIEIEKQISIQEDRVKIYEVPTDAKETEEYKKCAIELDAINQRIADRDVAMKEQDTKEADIRAKRMELNSVRDELARQKVNADINQKIADKKQKQKEYAQALANAEKILYQLSEISMAKNEKLTDQVNSHFTRVKFRLFVTQKNGEVKDDCTPMVKTVNGEYMDATFSANTAAIELAKLDIIAGLQKFYGVNLPVFLDGAECLDSYNSQIDVPFQLIQMRVSDDKELVIA